MGLFDYANIVWLLMRDCIISIFAAHVLEMHILLDSDKSGSILEI
jgi:hypothetical protein